MARTAPPTARWAAPRSPAVAQDVPTAAAVVASSAVVSRSGRRRSRRSTSTAATPNSSSGTTTAVRTGPSRARPTQIAAVTAAATATARAARSARVYRGAVWLQASVRRVTVGVADTPVARASDARRTGFTGGVSGAGAGEPAGEQGVDDGEGLGGEFLGDVETAGVEQQRAEAVQLAPVVLGGGDAHQVGQRAVEGGVGVEAPGEVGGPAGGRGVAGGEGEVDQLVRGVHDEPGDVQVVALVGVEQPGVAAVAQHAEHRAADQAQRGLVVGDRAGVPDLGAGLGAFAQPLEQLPVQQVPAQPVAAVAAHGRHERHRRVDAAVQAGPFAGAVHGVADGVELDPAPVGPQVGPRLVRGYPVRVQRQIHQHLDIPGLPVGRGWSGGLHRGLPEDPDHRHQWRGVLVVPASEVVVEVRILQTDQREPLLRVRVGRGQHRVPGSRWICDGDRLLVLGAWGAVNEAVVVEELGRGHGRGEGEGTAAVTGRSVRLGVRPGLGRDRTCRSEGATGRPGDAGSSPANRVSGAGAGASRSMESGVVGFCPLVSRSRKPAPSGERPAHPAHPAHPARR